MEFYSANDIEKIKATYLLYGNPGMGKTTSIKFFPGKTLVLDIDRTSHVLKGCNDIDICEISNINTWADWKETVVQLEKEYKGIYDNIAVDNISELERCVLSALGKEGKNQGVPSQGDYQKMQFMMVNSLRYLKNLGGNIILTAWETTDQYTTSEGQQFNRAFPQLNGKVLNNVMGLCDVVARLMINKDGERGFVLAPTNGIFAKNQLDDRKCCLQAELIHEQAETISD